MDRSRQSARTDRDIESAVLRLMDRMPFEKITVNDIVEEAMINRSTFYLHFQDKYEVIERLETEMIRQLSGLLADLRGRNAGLDFMDRLLKDFFLRQRDVIRRLRKAEGFEKQIYLLVRDYVKEIIPESGSAELQMLTSMVVSFLFYVMEHPEAGENFSTIFMQNYLDITLRFFRLDRLPDGAERLMQLIGEANRTVPMGR